MNLEHKVLSDTASLSSSAGERQLPELLILHFTPEASSNDHEMMHISCYILFMHLAKKNTAGDMSVRKRGKQKGLPPRKSNLDSPQLRRSL